MPSEATRAWLYRIILAGLAIAAAYGLVDGSDVALWAALAASILSTGLAVANTSTKPPA